MISLALDKTLGELVLLCKREAMGAFQLYSK
jgi:hypothetical protein